MDGNESWTQRAVWLGVDHTIRLDAEILRRKSRGEDKGPDGKRINLNRSTVIRDLIDEHLPMPERLTLGQP